MDSPEGLRLRLMALLSLYDLLPYSISNPPNGAAPQTLEDAIGPDAVRRCLDAMTRLHPQSVPAELSNILRGSRNANTTSTGQMQYGQPGNTRGMQYSSHPASSYQNAQLRR